MRMKLFLAALAVALTAGTSQAGHRFHRIRHHQPGCQTSPIRTAAANGFHTVGNAITARPVVTMFQGCVGGVCASPVGK